jgi:hypothetical protein
MPTRFAKVSEIAARFRVSPDAVYLWIRQGKIPPDCVVRIAGTVRVDEDQFEKRLRDGALYRSRKPALPPQQLRGEQTGALAEDSFTTVRIGTRSEHAWTDETGKVYPEHPFGREMVAATK